MTKEQLSLSCNLGTSEFRIRRSTILKEIRSASLETLELSSGFAFRFPVSDEWKRKLEEFISFERQCCAFLACEIKEEHVDGGLWLYISGPDGTREFIRTELMPI